MGQWRREGVGKLKMRAMNDEIERRKITAMKKEKERERKRRGERWRIHRKSGD